MSKERDLNRMSSGGPQRVLETDFPLMSPPPATSAASGATRTSFSSSYQYQQRNIPGYSYSRPATLTRVNDSSPAPKTNPAAGYRPLSAVVGSKSVGVSSSSSPPSERPAPDWRYQPVAASAASGTGSMGRSGSLKRAYEEEEQPLVGGADGKNVTVVGGNSSPATSDYHSDNANSGRPIGDALDGGGAKKGGGGGAKQKRR